jgi:chemotaxis protein CheX
MRVGSVPTVDDLADMVDQVWVSYLDPDGHAPLVRLDRPAKTSEVHSSVSITGSWHGHIVYASSTAAARLAAAAFMAMEADEVSQDDVSDVLGELANIVGGNVKAMLPPGCFLSLPQVVMAPAAATVYPSAVQVGELNATWKDEPVSITMWQSRSDLRKEETE